MGLLDRLRGKQPAPTAVTWGAMVLVPTGLNPMPDSDNMSMRGFYIRDADTDEAISHRQLYELVPGSLIFKVAGVSFREDALQLPAFKPGEPIQLIPEPKNRHDRNAVAVFDTTCRVHVGYVPRELARLIGSLFGEREAYGATAFFEFLQGNRRKALSVLVAPAAFLQTLTIEDDEDEDEE
jgi:hypothetical protein